MGIIATKSKPKAHYFGNPELIDFPALDALSQKQAVLLLLETGLSKDQICGLFFLTMERLSAILARTGLIYVASAQAQKEQGSDDAPVVPIPKKTDRTRRVYPKDIVLEVLAYYATAKTPLKFSSVADILGYAKNSVIRETQRLVEGGHMVSVATGPRRPRQYQLTEKGKAVLASGVFDA